MEGCVKQWFSFVKPNFHKYVEPQRLVAGMSYFSSIHNCIPYDEFPIQSIVQLNLIDDNTPS